MFLLNYAILKWVKILLLLAVSISFVSAVDRSQIKILQGNDDGWAEANIRATYQVLKQAGYQSLISSPAENKSGTGSTSAPEVRLQKEGEYNSIPPGAPATGHDPEDDHVWYVNAFPVDGIRYALDSLVDKFFAGPPSLVLTGPNVGKNVNLMDYFSGTLGAANYAANRGIPAIAISVRSGIRHSYRDLAANDPSYIYAGAALRIVDALVKGVGTDTSYLPPNCTLNINLQAAGANTNCRQASDYKFVLTTTHQLYFGKDINFCGSSRLESEWSIMRRNSGCWASISVIHNRFMGRANPKEQEHVRSRLKNFLSCP
ncbi:hypothetical protein CROQUDRAFT_58573 [Cronartium quercuum f. sp. fusiforme G11]|uniref:Survival protein SurE-like phosphatase/nucleotidase domain-containing protein n=1 Tax=Cronartium quercuum f. sp. fusiforme G11 TaxID=708437 RepID=A0A9P6NN02_9BASI|nr:hypothetical protein CROQUDRAFT_58573 [Cronartium quercuum f. sp. fusiforme G11]